MQINESIDWEIFFFFIQILAVQLQGDENEIFLLCNTHLYFHPRADVVRCLQAMISFERIRETKHFYEQQVNK